MNTIKSIHIGLHLNLVSDILYVRSRRPLAFLSRCLRMYELKEYFTVTKPKLFMMFTHVIMQVEISLLPPRPGSFPLGDFILDTLKQGNKCIMRIRHGWFVFLLSKHARHIRSISTPRMVGGLSEIGGRRPYGRNLSLIG